MTQFNTEQEEFWAGDFGDAYIERNKSDQYFAANLHFFGNILSKTNGVKSVIEFGPNVGMNLRAIDLLLPDVRFSGVEINVAAFEALQSTFPKGSFINKSIVDFEVEEVHDLCLVKGVLIHLNPTLLESTYDKMYSSTRRYILVSEYYNPSPVNVVYRGHDNRLFKRDFAGELLDKFPDLKLVDYGFSYHRDPNFPQDDETWFLLEKCREQ